MHESSAQGNLIDNLFFFFFFPLRHWINQYRFTKGVVVPFSHRGRIPSEKTCSSHGQVTVWRPIIAEAVPGYVVLQCPFDLLIRNIFQKHAAQAAAVKAQPDGAEVSVCSQHACSLSLYNRLASDCRLAKSSFFVTERTEEPAWFKGNPCKRWTRWECNTNKPSRLGDILLRDLSTHVSVVCWDSIASLKGNPVWLNCGCFLSGSERIQVQGSSGFSESLWWDCAPEVIKARELPQGQRRGDQCRSGPWRARKVYGSWLGFGGCPQVKMQDRNLLSLWWNIKGSPICP